MNVFELMACVGGLAGGLLGAAVGRPFGLVGSVAGGVLGLVAGAFAGSAATAGSFGVGIAFERWQRHRALVASFGRYWAKDRAEAWASLTRSGRGGQRVRGVVKHTFHYGAFVDCGLGFPALLKTVDGPTGIHPLPAVGSEVEGEVVEFDDDAHEVGLSRSPRPWIHVRGFPVAPVLGSWPKADQPRAGGIAFASPTFAEVQAAVARGETVACELVEGPRRRPARVVEVRRRMLTLELEPEPAAEPAPAPVAKS